MNALNADYAKAVDRLTTVMLPEDATPEQRLNAEAALSAFADAISLITVRHLGQQRNLDVQKS